MQSRICSMSCRNIGTFGRRAWSPTSFLTKLTRVDTSSAHCFPGLGWLFDVRWPKKMYCHVPLPTWNVCRCQLISFLSLVRLSTSQSLEKRPTQLFPKWMEARPFVVKRRLKKCPASLQLRLLQCISYYTSCWLITIINTTNIIGMNT